MTYIVQYSKPTDTRIAVSDWQEHTIKIVANSSNEAISKFNATHQYLGTWMILDCFVA